jgi:hypothetical protein
MIEVCGELVGDNALGVVENFHLAHKLGVLRGRGDIDSAQSRRPLQLRSNTIRREHFEDGGVRERRVMAARLLTRRL